MTASDASSASPSAVPSPQRYVTDRWLELTDDRAAWWARSPEIGITVRLREVLDLARARHDGAIDDDVLARAIEDAQQNLLKTSDAFLRSRFPSLAKELDATLRPGDFTPGSNKHSALSAALTTLAGVDLVSHLSSELQDRAAPGLDWEELTELDSVIELLDSELAAQGYSRSWRRRVAAGLERRIGQEPLAGAIKSSLAEANHGGREQQFRFLFPVKSFEQRDQDVLVNSYRDADEVEEILRGWPDAPVGFEADEGAFYCEIEGKDSNTALEIAESSACKEASLWELQGGHMRFSDRVACLEGTTVVWMNRPARLRLMPDHLERMGSQLDIATSPDSEATAILADALVQLAQARSSSRGAALADLWTVAEAVFAGTAMDPRWSAGRTMGELAEFLYPYDLLAWLSSRFERAGLGPRDTAMHESQWALHMIEHRASEVFGALANDTDPLAYTRSKAFASWSKTERMSDELDNVSTRVATISDRAYLVRNLFVHRAQPYRARALASVLPRFAEILRACLSHLMGEDTMDPSPVEIAKRAKHRVRLCADHYARTKDGKADAFRQTYGL